MHATTTQGLTPDEIDAYMQQRERGGEQEGASMQQ
jgi:hypothetical protein